MGITGAKRCEFIMYTSKGLYVKRIAFDAVFWQDLRKNLFSIILNIFRVLQQQIFIIQQHAIN